MKIPVVTILSLFMLFHLVFPYAFVKQDDITYENSPASLKNLLTTNIHANSVIKYLDNYTYIASCGVNYENKCKKGDLCEKNADCDSGLECKPIEKHHNMFKCVDKGNSLYTILIVVGVIFLIGLVLGITIYCTIKVLRKEQREFEELDEIDQFDKKKKVLHPDKALSVIAHNYTIGNSLINYSIYNDRLLYMTLVNEYNNYVDGRNILVQQIMAREGDAFPINGNLEKYQFMSRITKSDTGTNNIDTTSTSSSNIYRNTEHNKNGTGTDIKNEICLPLLYSDINSYSDNNTNH